MFIPEKSTQFASVNGESLYSLCKILVEHLRNKQILIKDCKRFTTSHSVPDL